MCNNFDLLFPYTFFILLSTKLQKYAIHNINRYKFEDTCNNLLLFPQCFENMQYIIINNNNWGKFKGRSISSKETEDKFEDMCNNFDQLFPQSFENIQYIITNTIKYNSKNNTRWKFKGRSISCKGAHPARSVRLASVNLLHRLVKISRARA